MQDAILRNLPEKTGKDLAGWIELLHAQSFTDKKLIIAFLKQEHGLGHFQARTIADRFLNEDRYGDPNALVDKLFPTPALRATFDRYRAYLGSLGKDVRVQPCQTYVPFYRKNKFASLTVRSGEVVVAVPAGDDSVPEGFRVDTSIVDDRLNAFTVATPEREAAIRTALRQAYRENG